MNKRKRNYFDVPVEDQPPVSRRLVTTVGIVVVGLGLGALGYGASAGGLFTPPQQLDKDGCRSDIKSEPTTIVLVDATDPLTKIHAERMRERLKAAAKSVSAYSRFVVVALDPDDTTGRELFRRCAPRVPGQTSSMEAGDVVVRQEWLERFEAPLIASIDNVLSSTIKSASSPLLSTITSLTQRPDFDGQVPNRRLVIVSDMVEHSSIKGGYSQLRSKGQSAGSRRAESEASSNVDLQGATVIVDYLQRTEYATVQVSAHREFWRKWFRDAGATDISFFGVKESIKSVAKSN